MTRELPAAETHPPEEQPPFYWWFPKKQPGVDHELIWGSILLFGFLAARFLPRALLTWYPCPIRGITGYPCPSCGMTRATLHAARLEIYEAFILTPLGMLLLGFAALYGFYAFIVVMGGLPRIRPNLKHRRVRQFLHYGIPALLFANWIYLMIHGV